MIINPYGGNNKKIQNSKIVAGSRLAQTVLPDNGYDSGTFRS